MTINKSLLIIVIFFVYYVYGECGYKSCHPTKEGHLNIHLVPHTHDDLGWLKTFEQYYYGVHDNVATAAVQYILDSLVDALRQNSDRRFIYVETGFFWKWWLYQNEETQNAVKELVNNGQLEFTGGGWSSNDEGSTYYQATIDQMALGLKKLNDTFGECGRPKVGWQVDTFGHSREMASIFAQLGYDGFFLNRIDYQDHEERERKKQLEFVWRTSPENLGESVDIFTNVLYRHYSAPAGMCFDISCQDEPIVDDPTSPEYNVEQKALEFISNWINPAKYSYLTNNILVPMGDDFQYAYAGKNFKNMDKLISYMTGKEFAGVKYNVIYSTPSCYLKAVYDATNGTLTSTMKSDDFFPYAHKPHNYWSGYYTSRPTGKGYDRYSNNFLQISKQLSVLSNLTSPEDNAKIETLQEALGVFQHHDAITGTEKENVAHDYMRLLHNGVIKCEEIVSDALSILSGSGDGGFTTCPLLNISECANTENEDNLIVTLYNPLGRYVDKYVRLPIQDNVSQIVIIDPSGKELTTQTIPIHPSVLTAPGRNSSAKFELVFKAENIPPLGYKQFYYQRNASSATSPSTSIPRESSRRNDSLEITPSSSGIRIVATSGEGLKLETTFNYYYYTGFVGDGSTDDKSGSEPYIFRPDPDYPLQLVSDSPEIEVFAGPLLTEIQVQLTDWCSYSARKYVDDDATTELSHLIGPLPYFNNHGTEVVLKLTTDLEYDDKIRTDTNGRETIERVRNFRPTWNVTITEPEAGNYYPIVTDVSMTNGSAGVTVLNDRGQGGGSLSYQSLELMIHRNSINGGGPAESLNETAFGVGVVTQGSHYVRFTGSAFETPSLITPKELTQQIRLDSWILFSQTNGKTFEGYRDSHVMEYSGLSNGSLPRNVHLLTLESWGPSAVLLRLENFVPKSDSKLSGTSTVNLKDLFAAFQVTSLRETTLGGNQWLADNSRIRFNVAGSVELPLDVKASDDFQVTLEPMQIRTFVLQISY